MPRRLDVRRLAPGTATVGVRDAEDVAALVELARFAAGEATFDELCNYLNDRVDQFLTDRPDDFRTDHPGDLDGSAEPVVPDPEATP